VGIYLLIEADIGGGEFKHDVVAIGERDARELQDFVVALASDLNEEGYEGFDAEYTLTDENLNAANEGKEVLLNDNIYISVVHGVPAGQVPDEAELV